MMPEQKPGPMIHRFAHEAMATFFEVMIAGSDPEYARQAAQAVFGEVDRLEELLSRFRAGSDVSRINNLAPGEFARVTHETVECLNIAAKVWLETQGAFDVTYQPGMTASAMPEFLILNTPSLQVGRRDATDYVLQPRVDLGAIGKGYALDAAVRILKDWDIENVLLHSGTSTALALGSEAEGSTGWRVGIGGPWGAQTGFDSITLAGAALSGSGTEVQGDHVIDPRRGRPAAAHLAAWALCESAAESDALSTAFMVMETDEVGDYCNAHPEVGACVVTRGAGPTLMRFGRLEAE